MISAKEWPGSDGVIQELQPFQIMSASSALVVVHSMRRDTQNKLVILHKVSHHEDPECRNRWWHSW